MIDNQRFKDVVFYLKDNKFIRNQQDFVERVGSDKATISQIMNNRLNIPNNLFASIENAFSFINSDWIKSGNGEMLKQPSRDNTPRNTDTTTANLIPLLPIAARGGSLNDFATTVKDCDCEFVVSPIKGADFAMPISGDSMAPEYPNGAQILIKKIDESAFVEWGKAYVLDTRNGAVVKILVPSDKEDCVRCVSINKDPIFAPFDVCWSDVFGVYRVMMCMALK